METETYTKEELFELGRVFAWVCEELGHPHPTESEEMEGLMFPLRAATKLIRTLNARGNVPRTLENRITLALSRVTHSYTTPVPLTNRMTWILGVERARNGMRIADARKRKGMSQVELAEALGAVQKLISSWESGEGNPNSVSKKKLIEILGDF